jgi:hypothetical protein
MLRVRSAGSCIERFASARATLRCAALLHLLALSWAPTLVQAATGDLIEVFQGGVFRGYVTPYSGISTGEDNYNYIQPNGFPIAGPSSAAFQGQIFFYEGSDGLHFNVLLNTQALGRGTVDWLLTVSGSEADPRVQWTDDPRPPADLNELSETSNNVFRGQWDYIGNTDGGVIGPLSGTDWSVVVDQLNYASNNNRGISSLRVFDSSGASIPLNLNTGSAGQLEFRVHAIPEPTAGCMALAAITMFCFSARRGQR